MTLVTASCLAMLLLAVILHSMLKTSTRLIQALDLALIVVQSAQLSLCSIEAKLKAWRPSSVCCCSKEMGFNVLRKHIKVRPRTDLVVTD